MPAIVLITTRGNQQHVEHCCQRAIAAGVVPGMSLAHARALLPLKGVSVEEHDPGRELQRLRSLAAWTMRFTPTVSIDPPDGLLLDISGCAHLHRGERRMLNAVANSIEWLGFSVRIACASNGACARVVARYGDDRAIVQHGNELQAVRPLPIEGLRLDSDTLDALHEVNITRIGEVTCLPRNDLATRFGRTVLQRLDQVLGDAEEVAIEPHRSRIQPSVERMFDGPVKQIEGIMATVQELIDELCRLLQQAESGMRRVEIDFERIDAANLHEMITLSHASRNAKHVWSLLRPHVERVNLGFGVEKIVLTASRTERLRHDQMERWTGGDVDIVEIERSAGELIDTLANRLGSTRVTHVTAVESHLPERTFRHESASIQRTPASSSLHAVPDVDRPTKLFDQPEMIEVLSVAPEGPPRWMKWRGKEHAVNISNGPERIDEEWWREEARCNGAGRLAARDYFRIQIDDGRWLWVFRRCTDCHGDRTRWFVHGEWT